MTEMTTDQKKLFALLRMTIDSTTSIQYEEWGARFIGSTLLSIRNTLGDNKQHHPVDPPDAYWKVYRAIFREVRSVMTYSTISLNEIMDVLEAVREIY